MQSNEYPAFYISQEDSIYEWAVSIRFHEGMRYNLCGLNPCSEPDTYELVFHDYQDHGRISELDRFFFPDGITGNEIVWIFTPTSGSSYFSESSKIEQYKISFVRFKPPLEDYINYVLLVGTYSDKNGRTFTFHHPGKAKWPDKSFSYKISLDAYLSILSWCDYFVVIGERDIDGQLICYPFTWQNNRLHIYTTYNKFPGPDSKLPKNEPTYILIPQ